MGLTHFDENGNARMVDVTEKNPTIRTATAVGSLLVSEEVLSAIKGHEIKKGDVIRPIYVVVDQESGETTEIKGDKYRVGKNFNITEPKLPEGEYYYSFGIDDLFGSTKYLDLISFWVNKKGKVELSY